MKILLALPVAAAFFLTGISSVRAIEDGKEVKPDKADLKPGEYTWDAKAAPDGAVDIVVSLGEQKLATYRDGVLIGRSTISSGRKGYETPPGTYMIVQKQVTHHSNKYHEASMPFMERLTWGGLAIHAGNTPGHPESHGCMHVPEDFAKELYGVTQEGDSVLVAQGMTKPRTTTDPDALFAGSDTKSPAKEPTPAPDAASTSGGTPATAWDAQKVPNGPYLIVLNSADKRLTVFRKGVEMGHADLGDFDKPVGEHLYVATAQNTKDGKPQWSLLGSGDNSPAPKLKSLAKTLDLPAEFQQHLQEINKPGTSLVLTDHASSKGSPEDEKED